MEYTLQKICGYKDELVSSVSLCCLYLILASRTRRHWALLPLFFVEFEDEIIVGGLPWWSSG